MASKDQEKKGKSFSDDVKKLLAYLTTLSNGYSWFESGCFLNTSSIIVKLF